MAEAMSEEAWVMVYRAREAWQAAVAEGWLKDAGIPAVQVNPTTDRDVFGGAPAPAVSGVRVPESYQNQAKQVLKAMAPED